LSIVCLVVDGSLMVIIDTLLGGSFGKSDQIFVYSFDLLLAKLSDVDDSSVRMISVKVMSSVNRVIQKCND